MAIAGSARSVVKLSDEQREAARGLAIHELWRRANLSWKLDETQQELYEFIRASQLTRITLECSRQLGKSFTCLLLASEIALANPGVRILYICKTYASSKGITDASMEAIFSDAPEDCRAEKVGNAFRFPNGSYIDIIGADDDRGVARTRGGAVAAIFIDEAAFIDCLPRLLETVTPMLSHYPGAKVVLLSSPPVNMEHHFIQVADACLANGSYIHRDYRSPGRQSLEQKEKNHAQEAKNALLTLEEFRLTPYFQREYLALRVRDVTLAVVPAFTPEVAAATVREHPRAPFYDSYTACDPGMSPDFTGILYAWVDYLKGLLIIEDEDLIKQSNSTRIIAELVAAKELLHFPDSADPSKARRPFMRVIDDGSKRVIADLWAEHNQSWSPAQKDDSDFAFNQLNLLVHSKRVIINPRCVNLQRQLRNAIKTKTGDMARTKADGHQDLVAALKYMVRSISWTCNPYPAWATRPDYLNYSHGRSEPQSTSPWAALANKRR